jgi:hypothetical protein
MEMIPLLALHRHVSLWGHPDSFQQLLQVLVLVLELVLVLVEAAGASTC